MAKKLIGVYGANKNINDMTDEEFDAWADESYDFLVEKLKEATKEAE